jgi:hypothetical protein
MSKRIPGMPVVALGLLLAASAMPAQEPAHTETTTKHTGAGPNTKTKTEWVTGTVKEYDAGKKIKIEGPGGKDYSFDLDTDAHVRGNIAVGQMAKVGYTKAADGSEHVTVISEGKGSGSHGASATGERVHSEQVVKNTGPGPDTKTKKEVVVGTVKEYNPGKSIKVTGPGDKNYTFDLDEGAGIQGDVSIGERVRVTYTKTDGDNKATTIQPDHGGK